jgi:hypothetical protein
MLEDLERFPKSYPEKHDKLADARGYDIKYQGETWRAIYLIDDDIGEVDILSFGPHDEDIIKLNAGPNTSARSTPTSRRG